MSRRRDAEDPRIGAPSPADGPTTPARPAVRRAQARPDDAHPDDAHEARRAVADRPTERVTRPGAAEGVASTRSRPGRTRTSGTWVGLVLGAVVMVFLLVFILQNLVLVEVSFLGLHGTLPLGIWLLFAAVAGMLLLAVPGLGRLLPWRRASGPRTRSHE